MKTFTKFSKLTSAAAIFMASTTLGFAEDKTGVNTSPMAQGKSGPVAEFAMAQDLYRYGVAHEDALSVLTAARITQSIDLTDVEREVETKVMDGADTTEAGEGVDAPVDAMQMLAAATDLAGGDPGLTGLIEDAKAESSRGRIGGATRTLSRLRAGRTDIYTVPFYGGSLAEIGISGDGDADLDLLVTDENGNTICIDHSYSDQLYCSFTPAWSGNFVIIVENVGRIRNSYYILTN